MKKKTEVVKVLVLENDESDVQLLRRLLREANGYSFQVESRDRLSGGLARLAFGDIQVAISDLHLPDSDGLETIEQLRRKAPKVPIVVLATASEERVAQKAVQNGAKDYLVKDRVDSQLLLRTIRYVIEMKRAEEALESVHQQTEHLLASIPSILIGLNVDGRITFWNAASESTFQTTRDHVLGKTLEGLGIRWDMKKLAESMAQCQRDGYPVRLNDMAFLRPDGGQGFLGITIIPVKGPMRERLGFLLFGADITERMRLEKLKDEFVSTVSHELRTPLTVIREGVSQVLDGILGETTENQRLFLSVSLQSIDRLGGIINDLLDMSKIEADKLDLKLDLVDLVSLVENLIAPSSPFQLQAKERHLTLKASLPREPLEVYLDRDKVVQVFTNLIGNALKFTEHGSIEISVLDRKGEIECRVSDTGKGIAREDLPQVFTKFMQFGRTHGPGDQGTGLGLAISKGLVELHQGKIVVESKTGRGTTFSFTIPKLTAAEVWRHHISQALRKAIQSESSMSIIVFTMEHFKDFEKQFGSEKAAGLMEKFERSVRLGLRRKADIAVRAQESILVVLPATRKEDALRVARRIADEGAKYLAQAEFPKASGLSYRVSAHPEDGSTEQELLKPLI